MPIVAIGWIYVVGMAAIAEAVSARGSVLGAIITFVAYGLLPLAIVLYVMGTPARKAAARRAEMEADLKAAAGSSAPTPSGGADPDGRGHAPGGHLPGGAAEREER